MPASWRTRSAHVAARHGMRQMTRANMAQIRTIPLIFIGGGIGYGMYEAAGLGLPLTFMKFQRNFEAEADYLGLQYMYKTGYDPQAFISFFEKIQAKEKKKPGTIAKAFASHPQTPDRIADSQQEIETILPAKAQYIVSTSEFDDVKSRLAMIENRHKVIDEKEQNKPTLRRSSTTDKSGGSDKSGDDDRPTLKAAGWRSRARIKFQELDSKIKPAGDITCRFLIGFVLPRCLDFDCVSAYDPAALTSQ